MPVDKQSPAYREGYQAFRDGVYIADKPMHFVLQEWEAGWLDAMADMVRQLLGKRDIS